MTDFVIAIPEWAMGSSVTATLDVLSVANRVAATLRKKSIHWRVVGNASQVRMTNGLAIGATPISANMRLGSGILIIPGIGLDHPNVLPSKRARVGGGIIERYQDANVLGRMAMPDIVEFSNLARKHYKGGGIVCASCSGVLVLGLAGLLNARKVTTHWQLASFLGKHFPEAEIDASSMVMEDQRIITAGAAMAQLDLMLYLIRKIMGRDVADMTMKYMLVDSRPSQARYMEWSYLRGTDDTAKALESLIESNLPKPLTVSEAANKLNLTEKTLARRIYKSTGITPLALIQTVRMRCAQQLLDMTNLPIDEVAARVGYANATSLRKLTVKMTNLTPAMLRKIV